MRSYMRLTEFRAERTLPDPVLYTVDVPGHIAPAAEPHLPLTRDDFHDMGDALATRVSWDGRTGVGRITWRVAYSSHFGWSVVEDRVGTPAGDWYGAVITSPHSYAAAVAYLTNCIAPGRWWSGDNLTVDAVA